MKTLFRILGTAAAVAVTGAAIVALDKILNQKDPLHVEEVCLLYTSPSPRDA